jgi:KDO2-lipid IV(A) lauroyltransferase
MAGLAFRARLPARRRLEANLRSLLGRDREAEIESLARQAFEHFALMLVDFLRLARLEPGRVAGEVEVLGARHLEAARACGRGVILLSAHVGNWEWGAAFLSALGARIRVAARALRRREWVALMGDRPAAGERGSVCAWAAALARRTGAMILPAIIVHRAGGGYTACFEAPLTPLECRSGGYRRVVQHALERHPGQWLAFEALSEGLG